MINALTIDVEDWFHILGLRNHCNMKQFETMESRVEQNTKKLLNMLDKVNVKATFFVLGWVAEHFPDLVKEIFKQGHEIASHGYSHTLCYEMTPEEFKRDTEKSIEVLEVLTGEKVLGYRVAGFSIGNKNLEAFDILLDLGIQYDASIFPEKRGHGGLRGAPRFPYIQRTPKGREILEMPASCFHFFGNNIAFAGGGYLRLFPYFVIRAGVRQYNNIQKPVNVYLHPREIDPTHPRMKMPLKRKFKCYVNLNSTEVKINALVREFQFGTIKSVLGL